jgi:acetyl-CoA C-acetyltransferase
MTNVVITAGARTAIGGYGKSLREIPPTELGAIAACAALAQSGAAPAQVEHVVFGNVIHTAAEDMYMARVVGMKTELPDETPATTVNRLCGTGAQAIVSATQMILAGDAEVVIAGGAECMSRGPYWLQSARWGARLGHSRSVDPVVGVLTDPFSGDHMGVTAENLARSHRISREEQDAFAVESHRRAQAAIEAGHFAAEIIPVLVRNGKATQEFCVDEHVRQNVSVDALARLAPAFEAGGTVTAGNASGLNDAAAAVILMSERQAQHLDAPILARVLAYATCGVDPNVMGIGPVPAIRKALKRAGRRLDEVGVVELNEAFAAQALAVMKELDLDPARVNPNGGAIALGHPIGATGAILTVKLLGEMERAGCELGIVSLCIGGGQGIALLLSRP